VPSKSRSLRGVWVRFPPPAPTKSARQRRFFQSAGLLAVVPGSPRIARVRPMCDGSGRWPCRRSHPARTRVRIPNGIRDKVESRFSRLQRDWTLRAAVLGRRQPPDVASPTRHGGCGKAGVRRVRHGCRVILNPRLRILRTNCQEWG